MMERTQFRRMIFEIYCAVMIFLLFLQRSPRAIDSGYLQSLRDHMNLIPGDTIRRFLLVWNSPVYHRASIVNLVGNIVMFIPLGFGLPWVHERLRRFWKTLLLSAGIIILVELTQLFTLLGHCDVDDLILNLMGVAMGYCFFLVWKKLGARS